MTTITTRSGKGSPLTNDEVDANFTNLNTDKAELSGAAFTGAITTNSTFDGRDVATDGTKLDGIEALADVTDTANVTAAGAVMDSELTSEASVKALNQGVATTDSPTFAGLTTTADINFGDNDKAIFGAGSDLQLYHDGSNSYVGENGTGDLRLTGNSITMLKADATETYAQFLVNGAVNLYHDNSQKLATTSTGIDVTGQVKATSDFIAADSGGTARGYLFGTSSGLFARFNSGGTFQVQESGSTRLTVNSTGIDVTGTATMDGLTVQTAQGDIVIPNSSSSIDMQRAGNNYIYASNAAGNLLLGSGASFNRLNIDNSGDISFYEDTGTTAKFFWDASAESLGIGTSSAGTLHGVSYGTTQLHIDGGTDRGQMLIEGDTLALIGLSDNGATADSRVFLTLVNDGVMTFKSVNDNGTTKADIMSLTSAGNVGIGRTPDTVYSGSLQLALGNGSQLATSTAGNPSLTITDNSYLNASGNHVYKTTNPSTRLEQYNGTLTFSNAASGTAGATISYTERMRIDSSGNVGINNSSPDSVLTAVNAASTAALRIGLNNTSFNYMDADNNIFRSGAGTERMRIDSSGSLMVGTTSSRPAEFTHPDGFSVRGDVKGQIQNTVTDAQCGLFNRDGTDGDLFLFRKDGTTVGSIASVGGADIKVNFSSDGDQYITGNAAANYLSFSSANAERMRLDGSGNLGIGTVTLTDSYKTIIEGSDQETADLTDSGTHGATLFLRATGENAGSGGAVAFGTTNSNQRPFAAIKGLVVDGTANSIGDLAFSTRATTSATALTERMRLTVSGRLGLGANNPSAKFHTVADSQYGEAARFQNNGDAIGWARADWSNDQASGSGIVYRDQAGSFVFRNDNSSGTAMATRIVAGGTTAGHIVFNKDATAGGEVGRFDTSGNLLVGTTGTTPHTASSSTDNGFALSGGGMLRLGRNSNPALHVNRITDDGLLAMWYRNGVNVGNISVTSTTTSYNETSDRRLKDNIVDAPSASDDIDAIQVRSFDWKVDGSHQKYGMVAQELNVVAPDAVTEGETEEDMMGVDYSKLVPMLVKEIQSLRARVAQLEND